MLEGQVGRVARGVRERTGLCDRPQERTDALVGASKLEDLLDHGAVLARQLGGPLGAAIVRVLADLDPQDAVGAGNGGAGHASIEALQGDGLAAAWDAHPLRDARDRAHGAELFAVARNEEDLCVIAGFQRQRGGHAWEDDGVFDRYQPEGFHLLSSTFAGCIDYGSQ